MCKVGEEAGTHLIVIIQDVLFDLGRIHPGNKILHISKETTGRGTPTINEPSDNPRFPFVYQDWS